MDVSDGETTNEISDVSGDIIEDDIIEDDLDTVIEIMETQDENELLPSTSNLNFAARSRKRSTKIYKATKKKALRDQANYSINKHPGRQSFNVCKKGSNGDFVLAYVVAFMQDHVTCSCPEFKKYEWKNARNECCKHVALIVGKCRGDDTCYNGQKKFAKNEFRRISELLDSFDKDNKMIGKSPTETIPQEVNPVQTKEIPITKTYTSERSAKSAAPADCEWIAEYYVTKSGTNRGRKAKCRNCKIEIKRNTLCIRVDVGGCRPYMEKNSKGKRKYVPTFLTFRYCANQTCFKNISAFDKRRSHIQPMERLGKGNLNPNMVLEMTNLLGNVEIFTQN